MGELFSDQLRQAIERSGESRYAIGKATGIDTGLLSRFMAGRSGLSLDSIDKVVGFLDLELKPKSRRTKKTGSGAAYDSAAPLDPNP